jgi:hypothetical protein
MLDLKLNKMHPMFAPFAPLQTLRRLGQLLLLAVVVGLVGCEVPINVDFPTTPPRLVVEGYITNLPEPQSVRISRSTNFDVPNSAIPAVSGARVIIWDDHGQRDTLREVEPGLYQTENIVGISHRTYYLQVEVDGYTIEGQSTLPDVVELQALFLQDTVRPPTFERSLYVTTFGRDPDTLGNYYRQRYFTNDSLHRDGPLDFLIVEDKFINGQNIVFPYGYITRPGDSITVELMSLTRDGFQFYSSLQAQAVTGSPLAPPPGNIFTNLRGAPGVLGIFSAEGRHRLSVIIPE